MPSEPVVVCLGYPALGSPAQRKALQALDPRVEVVDLPIDPDGNWMEIPPAQPHPEPPPWATTVAEPRRAALAQAEVLIALHTPADLMEHAPRLRWVHGVGAGVEQFGRAGLDGERVVLTNSSGMGSRSMAEFVIGRMLQVYKGFREQEGYQRDHEFVRNYGRTLSGATVGIVGLGAIGQAVAVRARALGLRVLGSRRSYRPGMTSDSVDELFGMDQLHELLGRSDIVVISAPSTPETYHLIDAKALAATRAGALFINVARGELVDEPALVESLQNGHLGAAALDVFEEEPLPTDSPLWDLPNVYISAHCSVSTDRYMDDVFELFVENLGHYLAERELVNQVDTATLLG